MHGKPAKLLSVKIIRIKLGRKLVKVFGLYSSEVEHWSAKTFDRAHDIV